MIDVSKFSPTIYQQRLVPSSWTIFKNRPKRFISLHHSAGTSLFTPRAGGSAHRCIMPNGIVWEQVPDEHAAHTVLNTNKYRPPQILKCPGGKVSDANYCGLSYELIYAPQSPYFQRPTIAMLTSLRWCLLRDYYRYGPLGVFNHGEIQPDKWPTEPHGISDHYEDLGLGEWTEYGRFLLPPPPEPPVMDTPDAEMKAYFESYGVGVNLDTALMQLAVVAYRRGETRGPAIAWIPKGETEPISGEYGYKDKVRMRFTAGTAEYDPATGGSAWVEINIDTEETD